MANGNGWQKQYPEKYHAGIGEFLRRNPGDIERIPNVSFIESGGEDWGDYAPWEGRTFDPTNIPEAITEPITDVPTDDYGLAFRPGVLDEDARGMSDYDWITGEQGREIPDLLGLGIGEDVPGSAEALEAAGYSFAKPQAGQTDWTIYDPEGNIVPFALTGGDGSGSSAGGGGGDGTGGSGFDPNVQTTLSPEAQCAASGGTWNGFECIQPVSGITADEGIVRPTTDLPPEWLGDILPREDAIPLQPPAFEELTVVPVGEDPLSMLASADLASLMTTGGVAPTPLAGNIEQTLQDILAGRGAGAEAVSPLGEQVLDMTAARIASGGRLPSDVRRRTMAIEAARTPLDVLRQSQLAEGRAALAQRGLLGSGAEPEFMERLESRLAPEYARAGQQIQLAEQERQEQRLQDAMELGARTASEQAQLRENRLAQAMSQASNLSAEQSRNLLSTVDTLNERQAMLNDIAVQSLDRNMAWNQFLAEYGLNRAEVLETIQQGRINALLPLIQAYLSAQGAVAAGFVPPED
jgi:hypothetical protein